MNKVLISVEGQTEETFVGAVLQPHFGEKLLLQPVVLKTRRMPGLPTDKGGHISYARIRRELQRLLGDTSAVAVTTMYDFYALPRDFPGYETLPAGNGAQKVAHLEAAVMKDLAQRRFRPYLQTHEFEAVLFAAPEAIVTWLSGSEKQLLELQRVQQAFPTPEEIDDDPRTSPAHRIREQFPGYQKESAGSLIAMEIGVQRICAACPHFDNWLAWLESLA